MNRYRFYYFKMLSAGLQDSILLCKTSVDMDSVLSLSLTIIKMWKSKNRISCFSISVKPKGKGSCTDFLSKLVVVLWPGYGGSAD